MASYPILQHRVCYVVRLLPQRELQKRSGAVQRATFVVCLPSPSATPGLRNHVVGLLPQLELQNSGHEQHEFGHQVWACVSSLPMQHYVRHIVRRLPPSERQQGTRTQTQRSMNARCAGHKNTQRNMGRKALHAPHNGPHPGGLVHCFLFFLQPDPAAALQADAPRGYR